MAIHLLTSESALPVSDEEASAWGSFPPPNFASPSLSTETKPPRPSQMRRSELGGVGVFFEDGLSQKLAGQSTNSESEAAQEMIEDVRASSTKHFPSPPKNSAWAKGPSLITSSTTFYEESEVSPTHSPRSPSSLGYISCKDGVSVPIQPSRNHLSGNFFKRKAKVKAPKTSSPIAVPQQQLSSAATDPKFFHSTPSKKEAVSSSMFAVSSTEFSKPSSPSAFKLFSPTPMHSAFDTKPFSTKSSNANFEYAGSISNWAVPVIVPPLSPSPHPMLPPDENPNAAPTEILPPPTPLLSLGLPPRRTLSSITASRRRRRQQSPPPPVPSSPPRRQESKSAPHSRLLDIRSDLNSDAPALPFSPPPQFDTYPNAPVPTVISKQPSSANFEHAGSISHSAPVVIDPPRSPSLSLTATSSLVEGNLDAFPFVPQSPASDEDSNSSRADSVLAAFPFVPPSPISASPPRSLFDLDSDAPDLPPSPLPLFDAKPDATAPAENSIQVDRSHEPFSRSSPLCLDGQISDQSKYVVASGGYADVWTGSLRNKTVAIKVMRPFSGHGSHVEISKIFKRSWREYLTWSRLSHPNILECLGFSYDFSPQAGQPSLISPWMSNGTAVNYIKERPNVDRVAIIVGIARGLSYLHNMDPIIVHGDLRAGNVLISDRGTACLADFGLSRLISESRGMTTSSEVAGSLRWMAPELMRGSRLSVQSDVWAYGMTVLEIFTGTRPYSETALEASALFMILKGKLPPRPNDVRLITGDVWTLCQKCWRFLSENRPSINDVLVDIECVRER